uniref:Fucosyltransferase n=1 Tax=Hirondellea gigas TaxID=1518452 RepID=A0A6A7G770_9CRUS
MQWFVSILLCSVVFFLCFCCGTVGKNGQYTKRREDSNVFTLLWWTPFALSQGEKRICGDGTCIFTEDRSLLRNPNVKINGFLFYGSDFDPSDLPYPRKSDQWWALLHEESPKNQPLFCHAPILTLFNITSTFRQHSNEPLTLQYLSSIDKLTDSSKYINTELKNLLQNNGIAPVIYLQSDCDTPSQRDHFVQELAKHIKVDSYGSCLQNQQLPQHLLDATATMQHQDLLALIARYKFALALENAGCPDYITEKLWRPLSLGVVPVYWGAENIKHWLPNNMSVVHVLDYNSPQQLAQYLRQLNSNDDQYERFLEHKLTKVVRNEVLKKSISDRVWGIDNDPSKVNFIENFECSVCNAMHMHQANPGRHIADIEHYGCPSPNTILGTLRANKPQHKDFKQGDHVDFNIQERGDSNQGENVVPSWGDPYNHWEEEWHRAKLESKKLGELLNSGRYSPETYHDDVLQYLIGKGHFRKYPPSVHQEL